MHTVSPMAFFCRAHIIFSLALGPSTSMLFVSEMLRTAGFVFYSKCCLTGFSLCAFCVRSCNSTWPHAIVFLP